MENNENQDVDLVNNAGEVQLDEGTEEVSEKETKVEKSDREKELEAELAKFKRIANRAKKSKETEPEPEAKGKSSDLDYGEKAFLRSYDIKGADELALAKNWANRTGDSLDVMVEDEIFQAKLKNLREARATAEATPKGTKRSNQPQGDDFQTALSKYNESGELPEDRTLREKVLDARIQKERGNGSFSNNPLIMN